MIYMNSVTDNIKPFTPMDRNIENFLIEKNIDKPFNEEVKCFINDFSNLILQDTSLKSHPDLIALAFWMRKANINNIESEFIRKNNFINKAPIGLVIHFAPSNVDTIFIYSLFISLLLGNKNIVRISSKESTVTKIIVDLLCFILNKPKYQEFKTKLVIISYPHSKEVTEYISMAADLRVIWGGDNTINTISKYAIKATANEIKFANKYSLALIDAAKLKKLSSDEFNLLIKNFVNDTYWFGQQGCSSPRTICWINMQHAKEDISNFWVAVEKRAKLQFSDDIEDADIMNKHVVADFSVSQKACSQIIADSYILTRVLVKDIKAHNELRENHCGSGLFFEISIENISDLSNLVDRKTQTISYYGLDINFLKDKFYEYSIYPDRVVPIGKSLEFSTIWDGYDLLDAMSRNIDFK